MKKSSEKKVLAERTLPMAMIMGIAAAYALTCVIFIGYALLLTYSNVSERYIPLVVIVTSIVSVIIAGYDTSKGVKERGWLWGMGAGFLYIAVLAVVMMVLLPNFGIDGRTILVLVLAIVGGGLGGILGINVKK